MNHETDETAGGVKNRFNAPSGATMADPFEEAISDAKAAGDGMIRKFRHKLGTMAGSARSAASTARQRATEMLHDAQDGAQHMAERTRLRMLRLRDQSRDYAHQHPAKMMLASLAGGLLLGYILRGRGKRN